MRQGIDQIRSGVVPPTPHLETEEKEMWAKKMYAESRIHKPIFILNRIHDQVEEQYLREKLAEYQIYPIDAIYRDDTVSVSWLMGLTIEKSYAYERVSGILEKFNQEYIEALMR